MYRVNRIQNTSNTVLLRCLFTIHVHHTCTELPVYRIHYTDEAAHAAAERAADALPSAHSAHSIPAIGPGRHARMRVHTHTAPHAGMSHEADGHEGSSSGGSSDGGNGAPV